MPSPSAVPALIDGLVAAATTALPNTSVFDGFGVSGEPGDYLMIGVEDPEIDGAAFSADTRQEWATTGLNAQTEETGEITCAALSWNGEASNDGQKMARDAVYALADAVTDLCAATPTFGVDTVLWTRFGRSIQLMQNQDANGSLSMLIFRIYFVARL